MADVSAEGCECTSGHLGFGFSRRVETQIWFAACILGKSSAHEGARERVLSSEDVSEGHEPLLMADMLM